VGGGDFDEGEALYFGERRLPGGQFKAVLGRLFRLISYLPGLRLYAEQLAPRWVRLERAAVPVPGLPAGLAGLRIGLLTDVHYDPRRPLAILERGVALLNAAAPDVIVLGGDYVDRRAIGFDRCAATLGRLRAPLGTYAILGNHDYWPGADLIAAKLAAAGPVVLRNRGCRLLAPGGTPFWLVGLDDAARGHDDLDVALAGVPEGDTRVLLAHEPDVADKVAARGLRFALQLSGHTHGGQVVLPIVGSPVLPRLGRRYVAGLYETPSGPVYTSRGIGSVPPYLRFRSPPEVAVLTLTNAGCGVRRAE
jgi:hypothetical protein